MDQNYISHCKLDVDLGAHSHQPLDFPAYGEEHCVAAVVHTDLLPAGEHVARKVGTEGIGQCRQIPRGQSGTQLDPFGLDWEGSNLELAHRDQKVCDLELVTGNGVRQTALDGVECHVARRHLGMRGTAVDETTRAVYG